MGAARRRRGVDRQRLRLLGRGLRDMH
jgi:hypothetical protein